MTDVKIKDLLREALREHDAEKSAESEFLDMKQACELLHVKRNAIYLRIYNKKNKYGMSLPFKKVGSRILFKKSDLLKFVK